MSIPIEDEHIDIVAKAQTGLGISDEDLLAKAGITAKELAQVRDGDPDASGLPKVAPVLGLNPEALLAAAHKTWAPEPVEIDGFAAFNTPFLDMTVNSYICWDPASKEAVVFDTGADASPMLKFLEAQSLNVRLILLTHTHTDHITDLDKILAATNAPAFVNRREPVEGAEPFEEGKTFEVGALKIGTRLTRGHSEGGTTYVVSGLAKPLAIVGDAIFAGSMGGGKISYADALETNRREILTLPDETVLAPGHGPLTTVGEEKKHNPFFAN